MCSVMLEVCPPLPIAQYQKAIIQAEVKFEQIAI